MRMTIDLIRQCIATTSNTNPLGERELLLRNHGITDIENLGVTEDAFHTIDLSGNQLTRLQNLPLLTRLTTLTLANNKLTSLTNSSLSSTLPNLQTLILSNNPIQSSSELTELSQCRRLTHLYVLNTPLSKRKEYRIELLRLAPALRVIDAQNVKPQERKAAAAAAAALQNGHASSPDKLDGSQLKHLKDTRQLLLQQLRSASDAATITKIEHELESVSKQLAEIQKR